MKRRDKRQDKKPLVISIACTEFQNLHKIFFLRKHPHEVLTWFGNVAEKHGLVNLKPLHVSWPLPIIDASYQWGLGCIFGIKE